MTTARTRTLRAKRARLIRDMAQDAVSVEALRVERDAAWTKVTAHPNTGRWELQRYERLDDALRLRCHLDGVDYTGVYDQ